MNIIQTNPCLLRGIHNPHYWWYTDEGGGHMIHSAFAEPDKHTQHWCLGIKHVARHRGVAPSRWAAPKTPWDYKGRHCA